MSWVCNKCGKEHPAARTICKQCGNTDIDYQHEVKDTVEVGIAEPYDDPNEPEGEFSPAVRTDGTVDDNRDPSESQRQRHRLRVPAAHVFRRVLYTARAWFLAPLHILWMYKQAVLAFLVVFGAAYLYLF